jgi:hypothetical protein
MMIFRIILMAVSVVLSIATLSGQINVPETSYGLVNSLIIGIGLFMVFLINGLAHMISLKEGETPKRMANRLTNMSLAAAFLFIAGPVIVHIMNQNM